MPNSRNFSTRVNHVQPGSPVSAGNTSAATRELEQRTNYLREVIEVTEAGMLLVRHDQPLHPEVNVGHAVYWNSDEKCFDRALAAVTSDDGTGALLPSDSADCLGICISKSAGTSGVIGTLGMAKLGHAAVSSMIDGPLVPGRYYLSPAAPGKLVRQRPPVTVAVAHILGPMDDCDDSVWVFIYPQMRDFLEDHIHYQFKLAAMPAGAHVPPAPGDPHVITAGDVNLRGWLPADSPTFNGTAPADAKFGYNIAADPDLHSVWPPIPLTAAILEMHQPAVTGPEGKIEGLERVPADYVKFDQHGIWWLTDCYNQVPWDTHIDTTDSEHSESAEAECPVAPACDLLLSFLKMTFATDRSVVTSLRPADGEPIEFVNLGGQPAVTGDLRARLNIESLVTPELVRGGIAVKGIEDTRLTFNRGWITEGLIAGSADIVLSGEHQELLNPSQPPGSSNPTVHQGIVVVDIQTDPVDRELAPQIVKLSDVLESEYRGIEYLAFPHGRDAEVRMRFNIPFAGTPLNPQIKIRALLFGRAGGPFSAMYMGYYRIARPMPGVPVPLPGGNTPITFDVVTPTDNYDGLGGDLPVDHAIEVESNAFSVAAGDTVFVTIGRLAAAGPLFQADIGLIRTNGIILAGI